MTAPGNDVLLLILSLSVLLSSAYAVGRIHQWHKFGVQRDEAYHTGYDKASCAIIGMMTAQRPYHPAPDATVIQFADRSRGRRSGHHVNGQRLPADHRPPYPHQRGEGDRTGT